MTSEMNKQANEWRSFAKAVTDPVHTLKKPATNFTDYKKNRLRMFCLEKRLSSYSFFVITLTN